MRTARHPGSRHVFVDRSGRRRRWAVAVGAGFAAILLLSLTLLVAGLSGASPVHLPGFPEAGRHAISPTPAPTSKSTTAPALNSSTAPAKPTPSATSAVPAPTPSPASSSAQGRRPSNAPSHPPHPSKSR